MPRTGPQADRIRKEIELLKSGAMDRDFAIDRGPRGRSQRRPQAVQQMIRNLSRQLLTPEELQKVKEQEAEAARYAAGQRARTSAFKTFGEKNKYTGKITPITQATFPKVLEEMRQLQLADSDPDQWLKFHRLINRFQVGTVGHPLHGVKLLKLRFNWGPDGRPRYVAPTEEMWRNYFSHPQRGRWIVNIPFMHKCDENWENHWIKRYMQESNAYARRYPSTDPRHIWNYHVTQAQCKKPKKSLWVKIRKPLAIAAGIVAAVYLGPVVVEKIGAAVGGGGAGAGGAAAGTGAGATATGTGVAAGTGAGAKAGTATFFSKVKAGSKTLLKYVNRARSIKAIADGELPPPPIGIPGSSFREWATIVAKEQIVKAAKEEALERGVEYIQRKMTEKEERKLREEIAAMQRELERLIPKEVKEMPPEPAPQVPTPVKVIQEQEAQRALDAQDLLLPAAIVGGALLLGG